MRPRFGGVVPPHAGHADVEDDVRCAAAMRALKSRDQTGDDMLDGGVGDADRRWVDVEADSAGGVGDAEGWRKGGGDQEGWVDGLVFEGLLQGIVSDG